MLALPICLEIVISEQAVHQWRAKKN